MHTDEQQLLKDLTHELGAFREVMLGAQKAFRETVTVPHQRNTSEATVRFEGTGPARYGLLAGFVAGACLVAAIFVGNWVINEMRQVDQQIAQTRDEFNQELFEIRADLKGVRAYINKGVVPPVPEKEKKGAK